MIDFEKSLSLGENPFTSSGGVQGSQLWPNAQLGSYLETVRPRRCPQDVLDKIASFSDRELRAIIAPSAAQMPLVTWHDSSIELLSRRAEKINQFVEEVWKTA